MTQLINEDDCHAFDCGHTRSGKSKFARTSLLSFKAPSIYMNIQGEDVEKGFIKVWDNKIEMEQLIEMLNDGMKIDFRFSRGKNSGYKYVAGHVIDCLMEAGYTDKNPVYICLEECHLLKGESLASAEYAMTAGLKKGIRLLNVTQKPALCSKTLYTLAYEHYMFYIPPSEGEYMKSKGVDYGFCKGEWDRIGKYSYCFFNGYQLEGRPGISL